MSGQPILVVGTGRCGSTLLSHMIRSHPDLLSVSELYSFATDLGTRIERAFPIGPITGGEFWSILADAQPRQTTLLSHGLQMPEVVYPWESGRFTPTTLPPALQGMLPHLDPEDPDGLFDDLEAFSIRSPLAPVSDHYRRLFDRLVEGFGRRRWVERSGGSLRIVERLIDAFPDALVVHLVRDGRDTALSMSRHIGFRMAILCGLQLETLGVDPYECDDRRGEDDLSDDLLDTLPEHFSAAAFERFDLPVAMCGHYWSGEIIAGLKALEKVPSGNLLTLHYEELLTDPADAMNRLGAFADFAVPSRWVTQASALVRNETPRWPGLDSSERNALVDACRPGFEALRKCDVGWDR